MKSLKILGIIGLIWAGFCLLCILGFNNPIDYEASVGWGMFAVFYLIALSIVAIVKSRKAQQ